MLGRARALSPGTVLCCGDRRLEVLSSSEKDSVSVTVDLEGVTGQEEAMTLTGEEVYAFPEQVAVSGYPLPVYLFEGFTVVSRGKRFPVVEVEWNPVNPMALLERSGGVFPAPLNLLAGGRVDLDRREIEVDLPMGLEEL